MTGAQKALRRPLCTAVPGWPPSHGRRQKYPSAAAQRGRFQVGAVPMVGAQKPLGGCSARPLPGGSRPHGRRPKALRRPLCEAAPGWAPTPLSAPKKHFGGCSAPPLPGGRRSHDRRPKSPLAAALSRRSRVNAGPMVGGQEASRRPLCAAAPGWAPPHGRGPK